MAYRKSLTPQPETLSYSMLGVAEPIRAAFHQRGCSKHPEARHNFDFLNPKP